jgi:hypothetical protein
LWRERRSEDRGGHAAPERSLWREDEKNAMRGFPFLLPREWPRASRSNSLSRESSARRAVFAFFEEKGAKRRARGGRRGARGAPRLRKETRRRVGARRRSDKREGRRARGEINLLVVVQTHRLLNSSKPNTGSTPSARSSRRRGARHGELERGFYFEERREREEEERARRPPTLSLAREAGFFRLWSPLCARAVSRRKEVPFPLSFDSIAKQTSHSRSDAKKPSLGPRSGLRIAL